MNADVKLRMISSRFALRVAPTRAHIKKTCSAGIVAFKAIRTWAGLLKCADGNMLGLFRVVMAIGDENRLLCKRFGCWLRVELSANH